MTRIFSTLALVSLALVSIALVLGLTGGDYNGPYHQLRLTRLQIAQWEGEGRVQEGKHAQNIERANRELDELFAEMIRLRSRAARHTLVGMGAGLLVVLVNSISITYFIGTSRWCREVIEAYRLSPSLVERSRQLKRRAFPWSMAGIVMVMVLVALGAAADPGTLRDNTQQWVVPHMAAAVLALSLFAVSFWWQWQIMGENGTLIEEILVLVRQVRREHGLDQARGVRQIVS